MYSIEKEVYEDPRSTLNLVPILRNLMLKIYSLNTTEPNDVFRNFQAMNRGKISTVVYTNMLIYMMTFLSHLGSGPLYMGRTLLPPALSHALPNALPDTPSAYGVEA